MHAGPGDRRVLLAIAGAGSARAWRGAPGAAFDSAACCRMRRFLSTGAPRTRALGGLRFDAVREPAPEWAAFGSFLFVLPLLELSEARLAPNSIPTAPRCHIPSPPALTSMDTKRTHKRTQAQR